MTRREIHFLLNGTPVALADLAADATLLDYLRLDRAMKGTKEGCAEGDCGACTVLVGRLSGDDLVYESVNACIRFVGSLDGCHVVTIEHLKRPDGRLHPVQQAMVDHHGSQCGFCTPGFVMSLYALWMREANPSDEAIEKALQGNLCRCTGYEAIIRAARTISGYGAPEHDLLAAERKDVISQLKAMQDGARVDIEHNGSRMILPADCDDLAQVLQDMPDATIVAGATDVGLWVTKFMRDISPVVFIAHLDELKTTRLEGPSLVIGAGVSYSDAFDACHAHIPALAGLINRIGGEQVRNMGTIGGNIANGSPIGDMPPPLIALGASLTLRKGAKRRTLPLEEFFIAYGKQDRASDEFVESVTVPLPEADDPFAVYKVSKRREEDITSVLGAFHLSLDGDRVRQIRIAYGGMAATPKRALAVENALAGKAWSPETVEAALQAFETDYQPLTDMRASAEYRMMVAKNLLRRFFLETTGTVSSGKAA